MNRTEWLIKYIVEQVELQDISVTDFCKKVHISRSTFYDWKNRGKSILIDSADRALKVLNCKFTLGKEDLL